MASVPGLRVRRSIADIQADYDAGHKKELEDLIDVRELNPEFSRDGLRLSVVLDRGEISHGGVNPV